MNAATLAAPEDVANENPPPVAAETAPALPDDVIRDLDRLKQIRRLGHEVDEQKQVLEEAETEVARVEAELKDVRADRNEAESQLNALLEDLAELADGKFPERLPFKADGATAHNEPTAAESDAWRAVRLTETAIPAKLIDVLRDGKVKQTNDAAAIETLGQLADFTHKRKLTDIAGVGPAKAEAVENAVADFYVKHPEYCGGGAQKAPESAAGDTYAGLVWKPGESEFQWVADNSAGIKTEEGDEPAQFVITTDAGDVRIDLSSDMLLPLHFPQFFTELDDAKAWCSARNKELCSPEAHKQMPEAFDEQPAEAEQEPKDDKPAKKKGKR